MKTAELVFEEYPDDTYTLQISPVSVRKFFDFVGEWAQDSTWEDYLAQLTRFTDLASPALNGTPLSADAFLEGDNALAKAIVNQWIVAVRDVPPPLLAGSGGTTASPAGPTPRPNSSGRKRSTRS